MMDALTHTLHHCDCLLGLYSHRLTKKKVCPPNPIITHTLLAEAPFYFLIGRPMAELHGRDLCLHQGDLCCSKETSPLAKSPVLCYTCSPASISTLACVSLVGCFNISQIKTILLQKPPRKNNRNPYSEILIKSVSPLLSPENLIFLKQIKINLPIRIYFFYFYAFQELSKNEFLQIKKKNEEAVEQDSAL